MKKVLIALCATVLSAGVILADYSQKVTSNVALYHGVRGPMDFSQLFLNQVDLNYYLSNGTGSTNGVSEIWRSTRPLPYAGQVVGLSIAGSAPKSFVLIENDNGTYSAVEILKDNVVHKSVHTTGYVYQAIGTNVVYVGGSYPKMKLRIEGMGSDTADLRTLTTLSDFKLYIDGYSDPIHPFEISHLASETDSRIYPQFSAGGRNFYAEVTKTGVGFYKSGSGYTFESWTVVPSEDNDWYEHEYSVRLGDGAFNPKALENVTINGCARWPSYSYGFANINLGLDNISGFGDTGDGGIITVSGDTIKTNYNAYYDVVIGTSSSAKYMHSYVFGSQAHALAGNSFILGYGATTTNSDSTIVGFGTRPVADQKFTTHAAMLTWANSFANYAAATNVVFNDYMIEITNDNVFVNGSYYVKNVRTTKDATYGWIELYQDKPHDESDEYIRGAHNWNYGKTHGQGTFNIVAKGRFGKDPGLTGVYINDRSLADLTGVHNGETTYKTPYNKGNGGTAVLCATDYTIEIGDNARATETASSCQSVAIGRDALADGSATVAVGPNAFASETMAIALGWRANAVGLHAISIGSANKSGQDFYVGGAINPDSDLALAYGQETINVGYNGKATAKRAMTFGAWAAAGAQNAVQIGVGTNNVADSLQFMDFFSVKRGELKIGDTTVVRNGEVVGVTSEPETQDIPESAYDDGEYDLYMKSGSSVTLLPTKDLCDEVEQINIYPVTANKRNFTMTIPNEPTVLAGMPIQINTEIDSSTKVVYKNGSNGLLTKLPVQVVFSQPYDKLVIIDLQELDDGTDWAPHITRNNICFSSGKFSNLGKTALRGWNLHAATAFKIAYPTESGVVTNDVLGVTSIPSVSHLYRSASMNSFTATGITADADGNTWFEAIYSTPNGTTNLVRKTFNATTGITFESEGLTRLGELTWTTEGGDDMSSGYFTITTNSTSSIIVDPNEVFIKYVLQNNTTNTVKMSTLTGVTGGYRTADITSLKLNTTNSVEYITIDDDRTNYLYRVVTEL